MESMGHPTLVHIRQRTLLGGFWEKLRLFPPDLRFSAFQVFVSSIGEGLLLVGSAMPPFPRAILHRLYPKR